MCQYKSQYGLIVLKYVFNNEVKKCPYYEL